MGSVTFQARVLALILLILGLGSIFYQSWVQNVPLTEGTTDPVWVLDAHVKFQTRSNEPVKARLFIPPLDDEYTALNESFNSSSYGVSVNREENNRVVTWSSRRGKGKENLYYRLVLTPHDADPAGPLEKGAQFRDSPSLEEPEKTAAESLLKSIRKNSADIETFISETIKQVNETDDSNVKLLLGMDDGINSRAHVIELLLAAAHIPTEQVHTLHLEETDNQKPQLWLRTYNGKEWLYFNPEDGSQGLPDDHLVIWSGSQPLLDIDGGNEAQVSFSIQRNEMGTLQLAKTLSNQGKSTFADFSLYELPLPTQQLIRVVLMIPLGVLVVLLIRSLVGVETLGTFTPVLIALAFRETSVLWGSLLFAGITAVGLTLRSYLEHLKLQLLARLSVVVTFVVIMIALVSLLGHKMGMNIGLSVALFPMVILTMVIERVSIVWEERGGLQSMKVALTTLLTAILCNLLMGLTALTYFTFTFPGILLVYAAIMIWMGHYRGYRLLELIRFRAMTEKG